MNFANEAPGGYSQTFHQPIIPLLRAFSQVNSEMFGMSVKDIICEYRSVRLGSA